jgi:Dihydro-orotase-like
MIYKSLQTILLSALCLAANAQSLQSWTWDYYKMKFKAPDNMVVQKSDATVYEASNSSITMDIYPLTGQNLTYDGMKNAIIKWADKSLLVYNDYNGSGDKQPIYLENINGYWGCAIDGTKNGFSASALLLVNPDYPDINYYVWVSYKPEYYHDAIAILKSFTPM